MLLLVCLLLGAVAGLVSSLVPGLSLALPLIFVFALGIDKWVSPIEGAVFLGAAVGASLYAKRLAMIYHPSATTTDILSLDPALRLCNAGRGADAFKLMMLGTDMAWMPFIPVAAAVTLVGAFGVNMVKGVDEAIGFVGVPLILWWVWHVSRQAAHPWLTVLGFVLTGSFGYVTFHHPALSGSEHQIAPLLAGLFGLPLMLTVLWDRADGLPDQHPESKEITAKVELGIAGAWLGAATGFFAGLGASSLVSLAGGYAESDEDYLLLSSAGESSNDLMAVFLAVAAGMGRSGEAVLLNRLAPTLDAFSAVAVLAALLWGAWAGRRATVRIASWYPEFIKRRKVWKMAILVISLSLLPVVLAGAGHGPSLLVAFGLTGAGLALGLWCRSKHLPAQVSFGALALPLVLSAAGLVPVLNGFFF